MTETTAVGLSEVVAAVTAAESSYACQEPAAITQQSLESILSNELNRLSLQDREAMNEEIHGVHTLAVSETPDYVTAKLDEMERVLQMQFQQNQDNSAAHSDSIPRNDNTLSPGEAYREALLLGSQYIHDTNFRIMFLRADLFDPIKAAVRFVDFLQLIRDSLGQDALVNIPWTLKMFRPDELKVLKAGAIQILHGRDRAGRRVVGVVDELSGNNALTNVRVCDTAVRC